MIVDRLNEQIIVPVVPEQESPHPVVSDLLPVPSCQVQAVGFHRGPISRARGYILAAWSLLAAGIDMLLLLAASSLFLVSLSWMTSSSLHKTLSFLETSLPVAILGILAVFSAVYLVASRIFLGFTVGEWACGLRLGLPKQRLGASYSFKVIKRTALIYLSGIVILPALSLMFGKDLPGAFVDLRLTQKR